jgi:hypothetical protein
MKATIYSIAVPILVTMGFAQDAPPAQPKQPTESTAPAKQPDKTASQSADRIQEMKTQTYSGTLVDASCAGAGSPAAPASTSASTGKQGCALSAAATQFALQMKDGQTVRFDDVGNTRVQDAMKARKKWSEAATANKPIRVKVSGVLNGDKMHVLSVD